MTALQGSIGALNDVVDAPRDAVGKPSKPLPSGLVSPQVARLIVVAGLAVGLGLSALLGPGVFAIALLGVAIGYAYDLRLKGTIWAWLPFALGIPLLPVYAWYGAAGAIPPGFVVLLPAAILTGAALALGNQLADLAHDRVSGTPSTVRLLGARASWALMAALYAGVLLVAIGSLAALGARGWGAVLAWAGAAAVVAGVLAARRGGDVRGLRARAWELQAAGIGLLAAGWIAALAGTPTLSG